MLPLLLLLMIISTIRVVVTASVMVSPRTAFASGGGASSGSGSGATSSSVPAARSRIDLPPLPSLRDGSREALQQSHGYSDEANWLIPGMVLVGRYPGSDPYIVCTPEEQKATVHDMVKRAKVSTFLCLQGELPSQDDDETWDSYGGKISLRSWAKGFHRYANDAKTAAATLNEAMGGRGVSFMQFDIDDMGVIQPLSKLHFLIMTLEALVLSRGENVYIHCWGGCGRTGIVGSALLGALYKDLSSDDALAHVDSYFKLRSERALFPHSRSPETDQQRAQVKEYFKTYFGRR